MKIFNGFDLLAILNTDLASMLSQNPCQAALWLASALQKIHCFPTVTISVELAPVLECYFWVSFHFMFGTLGGCEGLVMVAVVLRWSLDPRKPNFPLLKG